MRLNFLISNLLSTGILFSSSLRKFFFLFDILNLLVVGLHQFLAPVHFVTSRVVMPRWICEKRCPYSKSLDVHSGFYLWLIFNSIPGSAIPTEAGKSYKIVFSSKYKELLNCLLFLFTCLLLF